MENEGIPGMQSPPTMLPFKHGSLPARRKRYHTTIDPDLNPINAIHALYELSGLSEHGKGKHTSQAHGTYQSHVSIVNTGKLVGLEQAASTAPIHNTSYNIPSGAFHTIEVKPDIFYATLVCFNALGGYDKHAGFAGLKDLKFNTLT